MSENLGLKHRIVEEKKQMKDMKLAIKAMRYGSKEQMDQIKLMFLSKKTQLVTIINTLKSKVNDMNKEVEGEIKVRDAMLHKEQKHNRRLKSEILKAKDVLMNQDLISKAQNAFKGLIDFDDEDKVFLENGELRDL